MQIAKRYLVPKQMKANGLREAQVTITDRALKQIIVDYTREAGVRNLEREIGTTFRKVARKVAEDSKYKLRVKPENLVEFSSKPRFFNEVKRRTASVGVATGMFYTRWAATSCSSRPARCPVPASSGSRASSAT